MTTTNQIQNRKILESWGEDEEKLWDLPSGEGRGSCQTLRQKGLSLLNFYNTILTSPSQLILPGNWLGYRHSSSLLALWQVLHPKITGQTTLSHISPGHVHSPGKLCRLLLCPSHSPCHSCPQKGGNRWAWYTESLPSSKDHIAYHRMWPPLWRLQPLQVPCTLQTHTTKPNSSKFSKGGSNQNRTQVYYSFLFIMGGLV